MTITTVKSAVRSPHRSTLARHLRLAPLALAAALCSGGVRAQLIEQEKPVDAPDNKPMARWKFVPTGEIRATFTDNAALQPEPRKTSQFIIEAAPGFEARYKGPRLIGKADYRLRHYGQLHDKVAGTRRNSHSLNSMARAELVDEMVFVDAAATISQVGISPFGQEPNGYSSANSTDVKTWRISPYAINRLGNFAISELRYTKDGVSGGNTGLGDTLGDTASVSLRSGRAWQDVGFIANASEQTIRDKVRNDTHVKTGNFNLSYQLFRTLNVTAGRNYDSYDYESLGGANGGNGWNAGFTWTPSRRTSLTVNNGQRYYGPSRLVKAYHRSRRTVWSLTYDDSVTSTRANFLLPSAVDTASLLDGLLTPNFPDPVERARAVEEYIRASGLPPSIIDNINFFSNRFSLQKQLRASMAFRAARTNVIYSAFRVRREALSTSAADSVLQGTSTSSMMDNVDQVGLSASLQYALNSRSQLSLLTDIADNESLTTGLKTRSSSVRLSLRQRLQQKIHATVELRHVKGNASQLTLAPYTENAISAYLTLRY